MVQNCWILHPFLIISGFIPLIFLHFWFAIFLESDHKFSLNKFWKYALDKNNTEREKETYKKEGKEWQPAEIRNEILVAKQDKEAEEYFVKELKEKCLAKGLDFEKEYAVHLHNKEVKEEKEREKERIRKEKADAKEKLRKEKAEAKFNALSAEDKEKRLLKIKENEEKLLAYWKEEEMKGHAIYESYQNALNAVKVQEKSAA